MNKKTSLCAPQIDAYIDYKIAFTRPCNAKTQKLVLKLFDLLRKIAPNFRNVGWHLYLAADRGPISRFGDYEMMLEDGEVKNRQEFIDLWHDYYPSETVWYSFQATHYDGIYALSLNNTVVATMGHFYDKEPSFEDYSHLIKWIIEAVEKCIEELANNTYNNRIAREVPYDLRAGTINRKAYWKIYPEQKKACFGNLSRKEISEFKQFVASQDYSSNKPRTRIKSMTAHDFYTWCSLGYKANNYESCDGFPVQVQYYNHADGRDEGLHNVDYDSPEAFHMWLKCRYEKGGHPWEVCRGGSNTHISLEVCEDEQGYFTYLSGKAWSRAVETIRFCLALIHNNIPVFLEDAEEIVARLTGADCIGIVPKYILPGYCSSWFPGQKIIDFINLPYEPDVANAIIANADWRELPVARLKEG